MKQDHFEVSLENDYQQFLTKKGYRSRWTSVPSSQNSLQTRRRYRRNRYRRWLFISGTR